ncbi:acyl carrier protein [Clostridium fermenticellae]|uniref:Acyl carrier protein n=1 Tax=Clostridium fermenticellae TaxID=2068654 RepID=A0A386H5U4_9CLOT|nr:acyl carrier protein [Clostridium fermenticellae]AYD41117.1 acyl carrier protein [Clostridium fermenticellae]
MNDKEKFEKIISGTLNIKDMSKLKDEMGPDEIESWDSLAHVELVSGFEDNFDISIDVIDVSRMYTIGDIKKILKKYGIEV